MANYMTQNGYTDIHLLFVFKPQQNLPACTGSWRWSR